jgi:hypothetical protein
VLERFFVHMMVSALGADRKVKKAPERSRSGALHKRTATDADTGQRARACRRYRIPRHPVSRLEDTEDELIE